MRTTSPPGHEEGGRSGATAKLRGLIGFFVNRFGILYAGTGAVNALMIAGWLYVLTSPQYLHLPLIFSTYVAVVTSSFTDYTWKSVAVFKTPLLSFERFYKYFLNASTANIIQYVLTLLFSRLVFYSLAYVLAVAVGFVFAFTISRLLIWKRHPQDSEAAAKSA
jgi:putative flippase GtrA